ncbi:MAG: TIR domain-containing protein [Alistipes senegalensis]|nr:TIR domain-containing protein [Alistipes senegalensis]
MYININNNSLRYGAYLGFKLSRLEWIWKSSFTVAQNEFESSKEEILIQLSLEDIHINESDYKSFSQSILDYFLQTDIATYSSILIGFAIHRCTLIGVSKDLKNNDELQNLAKSSLTSIPKKIVPDKEYLFNEIYNNKDKNFFEILDLLKQLSEERRSFEQDVSHRRLFGIKPTLFLSYCEKDSSIADIIESQLKYETNNNIEISRYTRVPYKGSFKAFMNSIQEHDFVLCLVSDNYLKSQACMYEVGEIIKDNHFQDRLLFVVISENDSKYYSDNEINFAAAKIYGSEMNRLSYIQYWQKVYEELQEAINKNNDTIAFRFALNELWEIKKIYENDISAFLTYLSQYNGKTFEQLYIDGFSDIIKWILPNWESRMFKKSKNISELLTNAIEEIWKVTQTDYNQVALCVRISSHEIGLMVYADNVSEKKQRYRLVVMDGIMGSSFSTGNIINIGNTQNDHRYFVAVEETKSELVVPIEFQGNIIGVINSEAEKNNYYSETTIKKLCNISNNLSIALNRLGYVSNMNADKIPYVHIEFC